MSSGISLTETTQNVVTKDDVIVDECKMNEALDVLQSCLKENFKSNQSASYFVYDEDNGKPLFAVDFTVYH